MSVSTEILFHRPQRELASLLRGRLDGCTSASLIAGFMTVDGIEAVAEPLRAEPGKLSCLVVGAGTYKAFDACDLLLEAGVESGAVRVHLGFTRPTNSKLGFVPYHPMLHSKVYLMERGDGTASAFVGSHNLTAFALKGLNGEAGVLLEGPSSSAQFDAIRAHIDEAAHQAVVYDPSKKAAYAWWAERYISGLGGRFKDAPREPTTPRTMVVIAQCAGPDLPAAADVVYFEIPAEVDPVTSLRTDVHLYLFDTLPRTPAQGLKELALAKRSFKCRTTGVEDDRGGLELSADWEIRERQRPVLRKTPDPFRPSPRRGMQQIRVQVRDESVGPFEYLFDADGAAWRPVFDDEERVPGAETPEVSLASTRSDRSEEWYLVSDLIRGGSTDDRPGGRGRRIPTDMLPESGNYILMARRREKHESGPAD